MSTTYKTRSGDTFEKIARAVYGNEGEAARVSAANPGAYQPLPTGTILVIPPLPGAPQDRPHETPAANANETAILIDGLRFRFWESISITRSIDAMDTLSLSAPVRDEFRDIFRPLEYKPISVTVGGQPLFTGTMMDVLPGLTAQRKSIEVNGYSLPGVLNDCTAPSSAFPRLEDTGMNLQQIAGQLAGYFGLSVVFQSGPEPVLERVAIEPGRKVLDYLVSLAKQANLIVSSTPEGALLFLRPSPATAPVARLRQGESPLISVQPEFEPQSYFSHITGITPALEGREAKSGATFPLKNPRLTGVLRPFTFTAPDTTPGTLRAAVEAKASRMFANACGYTVEVATWRDSGGELWRPDSTITLEAPDAFVYNEYAFTIRGVVFDRDRDSETAQLSLVVPGSFSGILPEKLPWDG